MIFGITNSAVQRSRADNNWIAWTLGYTSVCAGAGLIAGTFLGALGSFLPFELRIASASFLAVVAVILSGLELSGRRVPLIQCDRETPQRWAREGPYRWMLKNGIALGIGATSRIGFWLWYAIPIGALLFARPALGAAIYGTYSAIRGMGAWLIILGLFRWPDQDISMWLLRRMPIARMLAAAQLALLGIIVVLLIGL